MTPLASRSIPRLALLLVLVAGASLAAGSLARQGGMARLDAELQGRVALAGHAIETQIERYRYLPAVIAEDARILDLLAEPGGPAGAANAYLRIARELSGADELYLLDARGVTLAASNHAEPGSFVGHDYSFRPYFIDAMAAGEGRYYAIGVTTGVPGYFLASRVEGSRGALGVAVAKVDMAGLAAAWEGAGQEIGLADDLGIVFLSGRADWVYHPLDPLSDTALARIGAERRYDGLDIAVAPPLRAALAEDLRLAEGVLEADRWRIVAGLPVAPVEAQARLVAAATALAGLLTSALGVGLWQRRQLIRVRLNQNAELERRVAERTEALAREIDERRRAQEDLRRTHESLVHAAKLAVLGRMSSTIVHEVSQPLSALDSTLAAAELHLAAGRRDKAAASIASGRAMLVRMQKMVRNLRRFGARQRPEPPEAVDLAQVVAGSAEILAPRLRELGQSVVLDLPEELPPVRGHALRYEQAVTNLILNAAEANAAEGSSEPLHVGLALGQDGLRLQIADRGPGIAPGMESRIREPFFTTRLSGEGLGLGLSITQGILDQAGGRLGFRPRPGGGTLTEVELPLFRAERLLAG
ncbi:sensor histidine kinase [Paracoccus sp. (in: a-proteobacteria)]|uniref:sensor histidine kinase n=1 Tax=Paracoccus sp. TaxID=267 RepID=UPI00272BEF6C|nr:ATP-binding protein [Paracoccus sp. (in: a-proteobacteria)]